MHNIGLIGYGTMGGGYHKDSLTRDDIDLRLSAVYDIREERRELARAKGFNVYDTLEEFFASKAFEMVIIAVPNNNHCPLACMAMEAGYHVMVEKPAAMSCAEIEKMIEVSKKCGKIFTVHHNRRWDRDYLIVKDVLSQGVLGKLHTIESRVHPLTSEGGGRTGWRLIKSHGGGMFLDWGIHMLDQMLLLIDEPLVSVYANFASLRGHEIDDFSRIVLTYESGLNAVVEVSTFTPLAMPRYYIVGDQGALTVDKVRDGKCHIRRIAESHYEDREYDMYTVDTNTKLPAKHFVIDKIEEYDYPAEPPRQDWAINLYRNLGEVLDGKAELEVKPEQVLHCFRVIEAAIESAENHRVVLF